MAAGDINDPLSQIPGIALADDTTDPTDLGAGYALLKLKGGKLVWLPTGGAVTYALDNKSVSQLAGLTEEASPLDADLFLMERASDGAKRKVQAQNLPGGGGGGAKLLGYAEITSNFTSQSLTPVDVTGLAISITATGNPIKLTAWSGAADSHSINGGRVFILIYDVTAAVQIAQCAVFNYNTCGCPAIVVAKVTPSAGARSYKVQMFDDGSATACRLTAGSTSPAFLMAEELTT